MNKNTGNIINVKVLEVGQKDFIRTDRWKYKLDKNYYFGGVKNNGEFEIAWGVGLDNSSATKTYKISYTVTDAVSKYKDCAEFYWQFIGNDSAIDAEKIIGKIKLPSKANSKEDIRVWGHVETLNGEIYATNLDTVEFSLDGYESGNFLEVRIAMPNEIFETVTRTYDRDMLDNIIREELMWAKDANIKRMRTTIILIIIIIIDLIITAILLKKMIKYIKILKGEYVPTQKLNYFREIPNEDTTPGEALFLISKGKEKINIGNIFSAIVMGLKLKGYIEIKESSRGKIKIKIIKKASKELPESEKIVFEFIEEIIKDKEITINEMKKIIRKRSTLTSDMVGDLKDSIIDTQKEKGNFYEDENINRDKLRNIAMLYMGIGISLIPILPIGILMMINSIICFKIVNRCKKITQKGVDEREKWKGLKKYMLDFSLLNEREIPSIEIWEEYLVYATAFGIANKVIKQLKIVYPQIEEMNKLNTESYVYLMSYTNFNFSFSEAISSSLSTTRSSTRTSTMSSGRGRRRRLLWRRRWPEVVAAGMGRKIEKILKYTSLKYTRMIDNNRIK